MHKIIKTEIEGLSIIEPRVFDDNRGYFFESFNKKSASDLIPQAEYVQDNEAKSQYGVVRGLHYQVAPNAQAKLVRVITGRIIDVVVDLRPDSQTYGKYVRVELSEENKRMLFIPKGFAHGYSVLSEEAVFFYKCDDYYSPEHEGGIHPLDPTLNINWGIPKDKMIISEKDTLLPYIGNQRKN
jgi:dTDP-4-dehydrorhamnose 3,5-epimerase